MSNIQGNEELSLSSQQGLYYVLELTQELDIALMPKGEGARQLLFDARTELIDEALTDFWISYAKLASLLGSDPRDPLIQIPWGDKTLQLDGYSLYR